MNSYDHYKRRYLILWRRCKSDNREKGWDYEVKVVFSGNLDHLVIEMSIAEQDEQWNKEEEKIDQIWRIKSNKRGIKSSKQSANRGLGPETPKVVN